MELSEIYLDQDGKLCMMLGSQEAYIVGYFENKFFGDGFKLVHKN